MVWLFRLLRDKICDLENKINLVHNFFFFYVYFYSVHVSGSRSQWPRGLRRRSAAARLLRSWVWIQRGAWIFVCCECRVLSGRVLCDELITHPEGSYRLWCVIVCDLETPRMRRPWPALGRSATAKKKTCFWQRCAHHQKKLLYQCDTWYLSLCVDDRLVCRMG